MYKKSANAVIDGTKNALRFAILLRCVRASEAQYSAVGVEKSSIGSVVEFASIIGLKGFYGARELSMNISNRTRLKGDELQICDEQEKSKCNV